MSRPTISLAMIVKDERENLPRLLESVKGCFDEIHITDTGSTDGTVEYLKDFEPSDTAGCPVILHHFEWVRDFAAARNYSFSHVKTDYVMWLDADDVLRRREAFISFRDNVMATAEYWLATYNYALNEKGEPALSFARERVIKLGCGFRWKHFVHEGCVQVENRQFLAQNVSSWWVDHLRTEKDMQKDRSRNLNLFREREHLLDARMRYYYGKELFDARQYMEAGAKLMEAATDERLEVHDRLMAIQYAAGAAMECGQFMRVVHICAQGLNLMPSRAEYWTLIGDAYVKQGRLEDAVPYYEAARSVRPNTVHGFVYCAKDAYDKYPTEQLASIFMNIGKIEEAKREIALLKAIGSGRINELESHLGKVLHFVQKAEHLEQTDDIVITCPPGGVKVWDDAVHRETGLGGSETACVELAEYWQKKTGRNVIVFNNRESPRTSSAGVSYWPVTELPQYFKNKRPFIHIAWRHAVRLTDAPSYIWCHDLYTPGAEKLENYDKILCLSEFHKNYVMALQSIPAEKVVLMKNGIDPKDFLASEEKNPNKIIFSSSPDRGLDRAIEIVSRARQKYPDLELHVFYGFENMRAMGMHQMADRLQAMIDANPWVKYHGNQPKAVLSKHFKESAIWLYPANFIETFCITALESVAAKCFPIVRKFGGVADTIKPFADAGMAWIIDRDASTPEDLDHWASILIRALDEKKWQSVDIDPELYSWRAVADEWDEKLNLTRPAISQMKCLDEMEGVVGRSA